MDYEGDFGEFYKQANEVFKEKEKIFGKIGQLTEENKGVEHVALTRAQETDEGYNEEDVVLFEFEDKDDARDIYNFCVEEGLTEVGEIFVEEGENSSVLIMGGSFVESKPELMQGILLAYEDKLEIETDDDVDNFEDFIDNFTDILNEESVTTSGAPKRKKGMGNPFHSKEDGKFTGAKNHAKEQGGSWAIGKRKFKFTKAGKTKSGGILAKYGSTKHPCGRAAREKGKDVRCWDGNKGAGFLVAKALGKKKRRKEDYDIADITNIMEMRHRYANV